MLRMNNRRLGVLTLFCVLLLAFTSFAYATDYEVFVGTYNGPQSKGIYSFHFDPTTGKFTQPELAAATENASFLALDPHDHFLYAVNELEKYQGSASGAVSVFAIDPANAKLTFKQQIASLGADPAHLSLDHTGHYLLVANYTSGNVAVFPIEKDGLLGSHTALDQHSGSSVNPDRQKGPHAHEIVLTADNRLAMSPDLGLDKIIIDRFDTAQGTLRANDPPFATVAPGAGPRHIVFSHDGKFAYVIDEMACDVTVFSVSSTGAMTILQTIPTIPNHASSDTGAEIELNPAGRFLYTSTRGTNVITQFAVDHATGKLTLVDRTSSGGVAPRFFALDPSGRWMFVANQQSNVIVLFSVDKESGKLTKTSQMEVGSPVCLVFVPASGS